LRDCGGRAGGGTRESLRNLSSFCQTEPLVVYIFIFLLL
jgi:hypothetical protein